MYECMTLLPCTYSIQFPQTELSFAIPRSEQSHLPPGSTPGIFIKTCMTDRKNWIYRKKCYLNHGESEAVFGNNDSPIGRNDSTCRNVFSLCLNDSRHAALPIGFVRVHRQQACTCMHERTHSHPLHPWSHAWYLNISVIGSTREVLLQHHFPGLVMALCIWDQNTAITTNVNPAALHPLSLSPT